MLDFNFKKTDDSLLIAWLVIIGTVLVRAITFMSLPFLTLYLASSGGLSSVQIGFVLGSGWFLGIFGGFIGSYLSDKLGRKLVTIITLVLWSIVFFTFYLTLNLYIIILLNMLNGLFRSLYEPLSQAILSDNLPNEKKLKFYKYRYTAANIGAAIGPLIGAFLSTKNMSISFLIASIALLIYAFLFATILPTQDKTLAVNTLSLPQTLHLLKKDTSLVFLIIAGSLVAIGVSQLDILPLLLTSSDGKTVFATLLSVNAISVIVLQPVINFFIKEKSEMKIMLNGILLFTIGIIGFGSSQNLLALIAFMIIFTMGEIMILPLGSMLVDKIAPAHLKGAYFGANNFRTSGNMIGPILTGTFLDIFFNQLSMFFIATITFSSLFFYYKSIDLFSKKVENLNKNVS